MEAELLTATHCNPTRAPVNSTFAVYDEAKRAATLVAVERLAGVMVYPSIIPYVTPDVAVVVFFIYIG